VDFNHAVGQPPAVPDTAEAVLPAITTQTMSASVAAPALVSTDATLGQHNRKFIEGALTACGGNISKAAKTLGVSRGTLYRRLKGWQQAL
jgi:transcriptional regulator of acetoin/glycerol metabolism